MKGIHVDLFTILLSIIYRRGEGRKWRRGGRGKGEIREGGEEGKSRRSYIFCIITMFLSLQ